MQTSPYTPGNTTRDLVGRQGQLIKAESLLEKTKSGIFAGRMQVYVGSRGVGKTSLLRVIEDKAQKMNFKTVWVTAGDAPLIEELISGIEEAALGLKETVRQLLKDLITSIRIEIAGISLEKSKVSQKQNISLVGKLEKLLLQVGQEFKEDKSLSGLGIFIDEVQATDNPGLRSLAYTWQHLQAKGTDLPLFCICAGLGHSQDVITDYVSFGERFEYIHLANLSHEDAIEVLRLPARQKQVEWNIQAAELAEEKAGGYPFFLQLIGDLTWEASQYPDPGVEIQTAQVEQALIAFRAQQKDIFRARWNKATPMEAEIIRAMAELGDGPVKRRDVAQRLGVETSKISVARQSLMDKGLIESPDWGYLSFTAPGFAEYVREQHSCR